MINRLKFLKRVLITISHLKPIQVAYQFKIRLIGSKPLRKYALTFGNTNKLSFFDLGKIHSKLEVIEDQYGFRFLNISHTFNGAVDWDYQGYGKLWNYNLQYLDFLRQNDLAGHIKFRLTEDIYEKLWIGNLPLEPYPASLRIMNVVRFLSCVPGEESIKKIEHYLIAEINYLSQNLEYHLLGNHLLENGFALLMGGHFFQKDEWMNKGVKLLYNELEEQILKDGAHFELSPMYHQIILYRVLEAICFFEPGDSFHSFLKYKASAMLAWIKNISFQDGSIPHFNDSCDGVAMGTSELLEIGKEIGIEPSNTLLLKESGYKKFEIKDFELAADFHGISPTYQPGHAHADTFTFCLNHRGNQIIVDPGISTYSISPRRDWERSTNAHNTIEVNGTSSSEVWAGFRVGQRAKVKLLDDQKAFVRAVHNGYKRLGILLERSIRCDSGKIIITDTINGNISDKIVFLHLHFHPHTNISQAADQVFRINENLWLTFEGEGKLIMEKYQYCEGFNLNIESDRLKIQILGNSFKTTITDQI